MRLHLGSRAGHATIVVAAAEAARDLTEPPRAARPRARRGRPVGTMRRCPPPARAARCERKRPVRQGGAPVSGESTDQLPDRNLALELVRVTEAAAMSAAPLVGSGDKEAADQAAVDGMR